jgi:AcrR family transcriptional regulator
VTARRHVGRPRGGDPVETRRAILNAAEECFAASGFAGATTRQMAARAGVNVATLHYHFGSKENLYRAVLDDASRKDIPLPGSWGTPKERLSSAVEALWEFGIAHPLLPRLRLFQRLAGSRFSAGNLDAPDDPHVTLLMRTLTEAGARTPSPPAETARVILALLDGALVAAQDTRASGETSSFVADASRAAVVAAALRVAGL